MAEEAKTLTPEQSALLDELILACETRYKQIQASIAYMENQVIAAKGAMDESHQVLELLKGKRGLSASLSADDIKAAIQAARDKASESNKAE